MRIQQLIPNFIGFTTRLGLSFFGYGAFAVATSSVNAAPIIFNGTQSYYDLINASLTWDGARTAAEQLTFLGRQGRLVTITSQEEDDFLRDTFSHPPVWIGGFQSLGGPNTPDDFQWITGEPTTFINWGPGEPNSLAARFMVMRDDGTWDDVDGTGTGSYLVEYQVPEPSTAFFAAIGILGVAFRRNRNGSNV